MVHPDKHEKDFIAIVTFLFQYINKIAPTPSVKVASLVQSRPAKWQKTSATHGTFKGKVKLKKYSTEEYGSMSTLQHQQLYDFQKKAGLIKGKKTPESSKAFKAKVAMLEAKTKIVVTRAYLQMKSPKLMTEIIQPLTEREAEKDRVMQILDS